VNRGRPATYGPVIDLMEALKKSLAEKQAPPRRPLHLRPSGKEASGAGLAPGSIRAEKGRKKDSRVNPPWRNGQIQPGDVQRILGLTGSSWIIGPFAPRFTPQRKRNPLLRLSRSDWPAHR